MKEIILLQPRKKGRPKRTNYGFCKYCGKPLTRGQNKFCCQLHYRLSEVPRKCKKAYKHKRGLL